MSNIFYNCKSLEKIPDISKWNTDKVTDMHNIFSGCELLKSLPDISKWKKYQIMRIYMDFFLIVHH